MLEFTSRLHLDLQRDWIHEQDRVASARRTLESAGEIANEMMTMLMMLTNVVN